MSLRTRIIIVLGIVVAAFVAIDAVVQHRVAARRFADLERVIAAGELRRTLEQLEREVDDVEFACRNLLSPATLRRGGILPDHDAERDGRAFDVFDEYDLDLLFLCEDSGRVLFGRAVEPTTGGEVRLREFPQQSLAPTHPLIEPVSARGAMTTGRGTLVVCALPLDLGGQRRARVIAGRFLTRERIAALGQRAGRVMRLHEVDALEGDRRELADRLAFQSEPILEQHGSDSLSLFGLVEDIRGIPAFLAEVVIQRDVMASGFRWARESVLSSLTIAFLLLLTLTQLLQKTVLGPVKRVTDHTVSIRRTGDLTARLELTRRDEIGVLAHELDHMVAELEKSRHEKVELARVAGISEIATGILHNVGNVLNSVNVSSNFVARSLQKMPVDDMERLLEVVEEHRDGLARFIEEDPRGKHLVPLLEQLCRQVVKQRGTALGELQLIREGIEHINDLVHSQQSYAGRSAVFERASVSDQVETALKICLQTRKDVGDVRIRREFESLSPVPMNRHKTLQILVNLILNAFNSLGRSPVSPKILTLRIGSNEHGVRIAVEDNGVGISADDLRRVFQPGFTTGSSMGLGLHMAATSAMEMDGTIHASSEGPGKGATFTLTLPANRHRHAVAA